MPHHLPHHVPHHLPHHLPQLSTELSGLFDIQGIPSVVILSPDLEVVTLNGKSDIGEDVEGLRFPWKPLTLCTLTVSRAAQLNQVRVVTYFMGRVWDVCSRLGDFYFGVVVLSRALGAIRYLAWK